MMRGYGWGWGHWLGMGMMMILFWGLVIVAIIAIVRYVGGSRHDGPPALRNEPPRPQEVLAERFARGEIDRDDYEQRLNVLREGRLTRRNATTPED